MNNEKRPFGAYTLSAAGFSPLDFIRSNIDAITDIVCPKPPHMYLEDCSTCTLSVIDYKKTVTVRTADGSETTHYDCYMLHHLNVNTMLESVGPLDHRYFMRLVITVVMGVRQKLQIYILKQTDLFSFKNVEAGTTPELQDLYAVTALACGTDGIFSLGDLNLEKLAQTIATKATEYNGPLQLEALVQKMDFSQKLHAQRTN